MTNPMIMENPMDVFWAACERIGVRPNTAIVDIGMLKFLQDVGSGVLAGIDRQEAEENSIRTAIAAREMFIKHLGVSQKGEAKK